MQHDIDFSDEAFLSLLLGPESQCDGRRYTDGGEARKLSCVSKSMQKNVAVAQLKNNELWKMNGEKAFGSGFTALSNMCMQAGYNPATMSGFYMNINIVLSGNYMEEVELESAAVDGRNVNTIKTLHESMGGLSLGRSRANDLCTLSDPQTSKKHAHLYKKSGKVIYHNFSTSNDTWKLSDSAGNTFYKLPRATATGPPQETELHIGDYVIIAQNNLSTLRVNLSCSDVMWLLNLMQATQYTDNPTHGPPDTQQALCAMELARAEAHRLAHDMYARQQMNNAIIEGASAVRIVQEERHKYRQKLQDKIYFMDAHVRDLKQELQKMIHDRQTRQRAAASQPTAKRAAEQHPYRGETLQHPHQCAEAQPHRPEKCQKVQTAREKELEEQIMQAEAKLTEQTQLLQAANMREQQTQQQKQCVICFEPKLANYAFIPCGHACCCLECVHTMIGNSCPLCREDVTAYIQVFR